MSPTELTAAAARRLVVELQSDAGALDAIAAKAARAHARRDDPEANAEASAHLALQLYRYYTALEAMLERIARALEGEVPVGRTSHQDLLLLATRPLPGVRPAILDAGLHGELSHLLSFRHFFRHAYVADLDWQQLELHRARLGSIHGRVMSSLRAFEGHLETLVVGSEKN